VITFIMSIPAALLRYSPVLDHTNYILGAGADTRVALGALLEILLIIANVGSAGRSCSAGLDRRRRERADAGLPAGDAGPAGSADRSPALAACDG
jgi:hypothetical protein